PAVADSAPTRSAEPPRTAFDNAIRQLSDNTSRDLNPLPLALSAVWKTLRPQDTFFCGLDAAERSFRILAGHGPISDRLGERTVFHRRDRNAFFLCHARLINLSVQNSEDPRIWRHLPDWMQSPDAPRSFFALPVHLQRKLLGIVFVGWTQARTEPFGGAELGTVQTVL